MKLSEKQAARLIDYAGCYAIITQDLKKREEVYELLNEIELQQYSDELKELDKGDPNEAK